MLSTLKFVLFTAMSIAMIFTAVYLTVLNTYKPAVKTYINGEFVGYFTDEQQFDEVYNEYNELQKKIGARPFNIQRQTGRTA